MNRNTPLKFGAIPQINHPRAKFDLSHSITLTLDTGEIVPFEIQEILPGDTIQIDIAGIIQMMTPVVPVMDQAICDIYYFYIPRRLTWDHWEEFMGQNDDEWTQTTEYEIPQIEAPYGGWEIGSIANYMGVPAYVDNISIDAQYLRSYAKVYSDWFRSENLQKSAHFYTDDTTRTGNNGTNYVTDVEMGGMCAKACKLPDYFTQALPEPQKGPDVLIPLGSTAPVSGNAYIRSAWNHENKYAAPIRTTTDEILANTDTQPLKFRRLEDAAYSPGTGDYRNIVGRISDESRKVLTTQTDTITQGGEPTSDIPIFPSNLWADIYNPMYIGTYETQAGGTGGLAADLSDATAATINELRTAFALQRYFEAQAMYGSRYIETLKALFGVTSSDARLQRSEYLGGMRFDINMGQVLQTSSTDTTSPQGNRAGFSVTNVRDSLFTKSFEEHGILLGVMVVRTRHTYQQGINKILSRKKMEDFYNPYFAHLGNLPILNKELYAQGSDVINPQTGNPYDDEVFGYQEAWAEYRYIPNRVSGYIQSIAKDHGGSLDIYSYVDDYASMPHLDKNWIIEPKENVDRTLAVSSSLTHQFIADFFIREYATRCMPVYSTPGLIDHV